MKKAILKIFFKPLTLLNKIIKKDENLIFFYSNLGLRDNVKAFYDYLIERGYNKKYKIAVSVNDYMKYENNAPENVVFMANKPGIKTFMKAKYAFYCFGKYPIKPAKSQTVVNLWHGTPLKKIGNLEPALKNIDYNFFTFVVTASEMYRPIMAKIFGCSENNVEVLGNPRNDELFLNDKKTDELIKGKSEKVILWLPTYREYNDDFVISILNSSQLNELNEVLAEKDIRLIVKLHPLQSAGEAKRFSNIEFMSQKDIEEKGFTVYTLLRNADGLITDYSSVYFDYLLLDRPIGFAIDDISTYENKRGFVFENPKEYMPGMEINSLEDIEKFVDDIYNDRDLYKKERAEVNRKVNTYRDGNSAERIAKRVFG